MLTLVRLLCEKRFANGETAANALHSGKENEFPELNKPEADCSGNLEPSISATVPKFVSTDRCVSECWSRKPTCRFGSKGCHCRRRPRVDVLLLMSLQRTWLADIVRILLYLKKNGSFISNRSGILNDEEEHPSPAVEMIEYVSRQRDIVL